MPFIPMEEIKEPVMLKSWRTFSSPTEGMGIRTKERKKNNVVIIIEGEDAEEIKKELHLAIRKMARRRELGYYITLAEKASLDAIQEFANLRLKISTVDR